MDKDTLKNIINGELDKMDSERKLWLVYSFARRLASGESQQEQAGGVK